MLPKNSSQLWVAISASCTFEHFKIYACMSVHVIKQMGLATQLKEKLDYIEALKIDWEIIKDEYSKCNVKDDDSNPAIATAKTVLNQT